MTQEQDDVAAGLRIRVVDALRAWRDLDPLIVELRTLPPGHPERGRIAAEAVELIATGELLSDPRRWPEIDALIELADESVPRTGRWARIRTVAAVSSLLGSLTDGRSMDPDDVAARLDTLARDSAGDQAVDAFVASARSMLTVARSVRTDDPAAVAQALGALGVPGMPGGPDLPPGAVVGSGPVAGAAAEVASLTAMLSGTERPSDDALRALADEADQDRSGGIYTAMRHAGVSYAALHGGKETDRGRVDLGVQHARRAVECTEPQDARRVMHLTGLALALLRRFELDPRSTADLRAAREPLDEARRRAGGPGHPQWQMIGEMLTEVRKYLGDDGDVQAPALEGLREHVWRVLAQDDPRGLRQAVRLAATDAVGVARTCLELGDPAGAVAALDSGRGLALFAGTVPGTVGDLLDGAGLPELAARWRAAVAAPDPGERSASLRREVLAALDGTAGALLDPPSPDRIGRALRSVGADALVYLVPGNGTLTGYAVVVSAAGRPGYLALPNLGLGNYPEIEDYLAAAARRDAAAATVPAVDDEFGGILDRLCTWAWGAAIGPVVESYLPGLPEPPAGRPRRIVLVPMGDLARVPWQAARDGAGRYAVERVAVSQAASARMLCRSAELAPVPPTPGGLVMGDPDTSAADPSAGPLPDLVTARAEAYAIRQTFYRGARYLGRRPDGSASPSGRGTVGQVTRWITSDDQADGAVAHLACHGVVRTTGDEPGAYLTLADGGRLHAADLAGLLGTRPERGIGLVVLSACRTGGSSHGHDEAYSLASALLAGGVRAVVCTHWNVPDLVLPALAYMIHHFHRTEGLPAWAALRRAQLWALDRDREIPDAMPTQLHRSARSAALGRVIVWAALAHWGR